jgi:DNA-binding transcriptional MerR regulator
MRRKKVTFSIGDASAMTGVSPKALRGWAERKYIPEPERLICGERAYRRYSEQDVEIIKKVKWHIDEGFTLSHSSKLALSELSTQQFDGKEE